MELNEQVIAIQDHPRGRFKKEDKFEIHGLMDFKCKCGQSNGLMLLIDVGGGTTGCPTCRTITGGTWYAAKFFKSAWEKDILPEPKYEYVESKPEIKETIVIPEERPLSKEEFVKEFERAASKKIVFLGNFKVDYTSETHHAKSLESLGHEVTRLQEGEASAYIVDKNCKGKDLFIWVHTHGWQTKGMKKVLADLKKAGIPSLTYHLDLWKGLEREKDMKKDDVWGIEHFFTVDKLMADWLNENTETKGHYVRAGVFDKECTYEPKPFENDIIFVGSKGYHKEWAYRPQLIEWLQKTYGERFKLYGGDGLGVVRGTALNELYANTKIVIGDSLCINFDYPWYWSDRVYETLGRGGFMIHPQIKGMEEEFKDGEHLIFYKFGDFEGLRQRIDYYLTHDEEREKIRIQGHEYVKNNFTYRHRWQQILSEL